MRETAYICQIGDVLEGEYVKKEGWEANYVRSRRGDVSRVNIIAAVVSTEGGLFIDDGTGRMSCRSFDGPLPLCKIGDVVMVIGKVREYQQERYILAEIIKTISPAWALFRKKLLEKFPTREVSTPATLSIMEAPKQNKEELLLQTIKENDVGEGVSRDLLKKQHGDVEAALDELLKQGEIYEIKQGVFRRLEF